MEYLRLFLRRHIVGKPVMALQSVDWWFSQAVHIMPLIPVVCKSGVDILTPAGKTCNLYYNLCTYGIGYINFLGRGGIEMRVETWIWRQSSCSWELLVLTQTPVSDSHLSLACLSKMLTSLPFFRNKEKWANMFCRISTGYQEVCVHVCCGGTVQSEIMTSCGQWPVNKYIPKRQW